MTATLSIGGVVGSATPAASAWVKSADPWPTRISVPRPFLGRAGAERPALSWVRSPLRCPGYAPRWPAAPADGSARLLLLSAVGPDRIGARRGRARPGPGTSPEPAPRCTRSPEFHPLARFLLLSPIGPRRAPPHRAPPPPRARWPGPQPGAPDAAVTAESFSAPYPAARRRHSRLPGAFSGISADSAPHRHRCPGRGTSSVTAGPARLGVTAGPARVSVTAGPARLGVTAGPAPLGVARWRNSCDAQTGTLATGPARCRPAPAGMKATSLGHPASRLPPGRPAHIRALLTATRPSTGNRSAAGPLRIPMCGKAGPIMGDAALEQARDGRTAGQSQGSGKGPELALRTGGRLAGRELSLRCLLGARVPSQAQPPVQPVPRSSPFGRTGRRSGWLP